MSMKDKLQKKEGQDKPLSDVVKKNFKPKGKFDKNKSSKSFQGKKKTDSTKSAPALKKTSSYPNKPYSKLVRYFLLNISTDINIAIMSY
jgi:hypothetical protein